MARLRLHRLALGRRAHGHFLHAADRWPCVSAVGSRLDFDLDASIWSMPSPPWASGCQVDITLVL